VKQGHRIRLQPLRRERATLDAFDEHVAAELARHGPRAARPARDGYHQKR
jgi:hypothetical protein